MHIFPSPSRRVMKAFTLVEFLVVLVILCVMAAFLFPTSCGGSRENARRSSCQSNLKQIGLAFRQYSQDYDERFPVWQHGSDKATGWAVTLQPYLKSTQIYQCPSEKTPPDVNPVSTGYSDYFYNSNLGPGNGGRFESRLENPALTIISGEAATFSANNSSNGGTITTTGKDAVDGKQDGLAVAQGQWNPATNGIIHLEGANYGFADGHVKWMRNSKVTRNPVARGDYTFRWSAKKQPDSGS